MKRGLTLLVVAAVAGSTGYAAGRRPALGGPLDFSRASGSRVATFEGGELAFADVEAAIDGQPQVVRDQLRTPAARKALIEAMVRAEVLARAAEERKLHHEPAFVRRYKEELARALIEAEVAAPQRKTPPTDAEVRAFFDEHQAKLGRPDRVRVAVVAYAAASAGAADRASKRRQAEGALAKLRGARDPEAFARVARAESDDQESRRTNGELPFLTRDELAARFGEPLAAAAFALRGGGELSPGVVESGAGFHVVKLLAREDGYAPSFEELKERIRARLAEDRRAAAEQVFVESLMKAAKVRFDDAAIEQLDVAAIAR